MTSSSPRTLTWLFIAETISLVGSRVTFVAVPFLVLETTGSPARMGVVAFAEMLAYVAACVLAGPIVDRRGPVRMSVRCDLASAVTIASVPALFQAELLPFPALVAIIAVAGALRGTGDIAKRPLLLPAVEASGTDLDPSGQPPRRRQSVVRPCRHIARRCAGRPPRRRQRPGGGCRQLRRHRARRVAGGSPCGSCGRSA